MRIVLNQDTVFEGARLGLITVADEVPRAVILREKTPFDPCRKTGAAAATQAGITHDGGDIVRLVLPQGFVERLVSTKGTVGLQFPQVGSADVLQQDLFHIGPSPSLYANPLPDGEGNILF
jgi:hypothetical protein